MKQRTDHDTQPFISGLRNKERAGTPDAICGKKRRVLISAIFLTGEKQVGKSTIIRAVADSFEGTLGGFITRRTNLFCPPRYSVHYFPVSREPEAAYCAAADNFLFFCGRPNSHPERSSLRSEENNMNKWLPGENGIAARQFETDSDVAQRFDRMGKMTLSSAHSSLLIMDELGPHEAQASHFIELVMEIIDSGAPVLGVLQDGEYPLFDRIASHPHVRLLRVTHDNRELLRNSLALRYQHRLDTDSCGAVVLHSAKGASHVLMISGYKGLSFPKGHMEDGELPHETAEREVLEETGVPISVDTSFYRTVRSARESENRSVTFFPARSLAGMLPPVAQKGEISKAVWVPVQDAAALIQYAPDRKAFLEICRYVL